MNNKSSLYILFLFSILTANCQNNLSSQLKNLHGIWIEENYLKSFDVTRSSVKSRNVFNPDYPVGLRINPAELQNGVLNVGYGVLHDHMTEPEVSQFHVIGSDTIYEQGFFSVHPDKCDTLDYYKISQTDFFNYDCNAYMTWHYGADTLLELVRPANLEDSAETLTFRRISRSFTTDYPYPNPLYYYLRSRTLVGNYELRDSTGNVVSRDFSIGLDGKTMGYAPWKDKVLFFSTDIYCGPKVPMDVVFLYNSFDNNAEPDCVLYFYDKKKGNKIELRQNIWLDEEEDYKVGKVMYTLQRK